MNKQPAVTEKTRQKFVDAFWAMAWEKPMSKIAVNELTKRAGYNRSTFYEYFLDTDHLLSYVEDQLLEEVRQTALKNIAETSDTKTATGLVRTSLFPNIFCALNEKVYLLAGPNGDPGFLSKLKDVLIPIVALYLPISPELPHFDYLVSFINAAAFGILQHWHEQNKNLSSKEVCSMMQRLVLQGLSAYILPASDQEPTAPVAAEPGIF